MRPVAAATRQLPGTTPVADQDEYFDEDDNDGRPLSKAERKRLRRNQQQRRPPKRYLAQHRNLPELNFGCSQ